MDNIEVNSENFYSFTPEDVRGAVAAVKYGFDDIAARNLIRYFHFRFNEGNIFDRAELSSVERSFLEYVEHAFSRIVTGKAAGANNTELSANALRELADILNSQGDVNSAERCTQRADKQAAIESKSAGKSLDVAFGLVPGKGEYRRQDTFDRDIKLAAKVVLLRRKGETWESAIDSSAELFYATNGNRVAEVAYEKFGSALSCLNDESLDSILDQHSPVVVET